ncbi:hypothetical protein DFJ63DRAFT_314723 [Scheffersomyces coipomensis]|uniref:uncharacterized protein n=1 Tax=Scheffersomyces coipomensis TaxID=1788519 RepID=UPI00315CE8C1
MKLIHIIISIIFLFTTSITAELSSIEQALDTTYEEVGGYESNLEQLLESFVRDNQEVFQKRDGSSTVATISQILQTVNNSGIILDILNEVASTPNATAIISGFIVQLLKSSSGVIQGFNVTVNFTNILNAVNQSQLVQSVAGGLLINDANRNKLASIVGPGLGNSPWVGYLLLGLGNGHDLTIDYIAQLIQTTPNKNNGSVANAGSSKSVLFGFEKRDNATDQYAGSLQSFLNNLAQQVLNSAIVGNSLSDILIAVNQSGIVVPLVLDILQDTAVVKMVISIVGDLYSSGVFENVDINYYYRLAQKQNYLSNGLEFLVSNPTWSPPIGKLLEYLEATGVYQNLQYAMYGPPKK